MCSLDLLASVIHSHDLDLCWLGVEPPTIETLSLCTRLEYDALHAHLDHHYRDLVLLLDRVELGHGDLNGEWRI